MHKKVNYNSMHMLIFFSYFELMASLFILLMAFNIFSRHYENRAARFYGRFALVGFLAALFEYSMRIAFTLDIARDINRLSATLWAFTFAMFAHFCLIFTRREKWLKNKLTYVLLYLPAALLGFLFFFTDSMYKLYEVVPIGIISQVKPMYLLFAIHTAAYLLFGVALLFYYAKTAHQKTTRKQSLLIAIGSLIPATIGVVADELSPVILGTRIFWPTCVFDLFVLTLVIYIAMRQYSLFAISPALAADIVIETMPDSLIIADLEGRVVLLNEEARKFFHAPKEQILGRPICNLFKDRSKYDRLYSEVVDKNMEIKRFEAELCDPLGESILSLINANKLRDALGATLGVVYIIRDIRG